MNSKPDIDTGATAETFLVIDDDVTLTEVLSRALKRRGYNVFIANTGSEALSVCQNQAAVNKVILDLKLNSESGLRLIPELLKLNEQLNIVVLTGYSSIATAVEAIKLGAMNYLCKPADANEILASFSSDKVPDINMEEISTPSLDRLEWEHIQKILQEHDGNISATARALNMHRRTLQRKLNKFPVKR